MKSTAYRRGVLVDYFRNTPKPVRFRAAEEKRVTPGRLIRFRERNAWYGSDLRQFGRQLLTNECVVMEENRRPFRRRRCKIGTLMVGDTTNRRRAGIPLL